MFIVHLSFPVARENREKVLEEFLTRAATVKAMKGCVAFIPFVDPVNDTSVGVIHEWETEGDFATYTSSASFSDLGKSIRPLMTAAPASKRFNAELLGVVN